MTERDDRGPQLDTELPGIEDLETDLDAAIAEHIAEEPEANLPPAEPAPLPEGRFVDRELSWLAFNQRVLELA